MRVFFRTCVLLLCCVGAHAASPVWRVERDGHVLYLGGTIHVLGHADFPLPAGFDSAYREARAVVFETDIAAARDPATVQRMRSAMLYDDGRTLRSVLREDTLARLAAHLSQRDATLASLLPLRAGAASITLTMLELRRLGMAGDGVDEWYASAAQRDGKPRGALEPLERQIAFLQHLGEGEEDALIRYTLEDIATMPAQLDALKRAWRDGDASTLEAIGVRPLRERFPDVFRTLLVERNTAWLPEIERLLATPEVELVLVGALHLVGPEGLLARLSGQGCRVRRL